MPSAAILFLAAMTQPAIAQPASAPPPGDPPGNAPSARATPVAHGSGIAARASVTILRAERIDLAHPQPEHGPRRAERRDDGGRLWIEFS
ncbi:MAG: hypothetical protein IE933_06615 [Sphingomonadales bacterium]|nr:hypothetical protein [Sphingomonadales bacterium]MBD3775311.1 hypothetical protein [Paracoccaceae bacterium]